MQRQLSNVSFHSYQEYQPARKYGPQYEPGGYAAAVQQRTNMTQREDALKFEQGRIKALQEERLHIQKKTFTKWVNSFLQKARMEVEDLFQDLSDGRRLLKLLEIISGERLPRPHSGRMRVHKIENVNKSLSFLHTKVRLESIGAEDIVDGNPRLILGLIWTIILRFQIQEIEIDVDEENVSSEKKSAKDALLLWCQRKTSGYHGVHIHNFTDSWRSGLGFNALIHAHRPDLFRWAELPPEPVATLNHAFDVAHNHLGIPKLLDAEDVDTSRPDEKSVMTYVASYYHTFARMKNEQKSGRRIANIIGQMMECDARKGEYSRLVSALLEWIRRTIAQLDGRELPNALDGIQRLLLAFKQYRTVEKPPKYKERSEIEALYFDINTMQKSLVGEAWSPLEGQLPQDLERAWQKLEQAEHAREIALRTELLRQQRLEQLNYKFNTKSVLRKGYLKEMIQVLSDPRYGSNLAQVDATLKKHEAISADILARTERFEDLSAMAAELVREGYHGAEGVARVEGAVLARWRELLALLERHRASLAQLAQLMALLREADAVGHSLSEMKAQFSSSETGRQLADVERLLQAHALQELTLGAARDSLRRLQRAAGAEPDQRLTDQLQGLGAQYEQLVEAAKDRKARLEDARNLYQFLEDHDEEEGWVTDKQRICRADVAAKDLRGVTALRQKHTALLSEMRARDLVAQRHRAKGQSLIDAKHSKSSEISRRLASLGQQWDTLRELAAAREKQLADAAEAHQFYGDANEAESWMKEKRPLVSAGDVGADAPAAAALLRRLRHTLAQLAAHRAELDALQAHAARLADIGIHALQLPTEVESVPAGEEDEFVNESRLVPTEVWEEEPVERLEHRTVTEERSVPQVKALYAFSGQGISMSKGEVMFLINKTNPDWWSVRKADRSDGFVPANYVREVEPRVVPVQVRRPEKVRSVQRVKKTVLVKQVVPVRRAAPRRARAPPATRAPPMQERVQGIFKDYEELLALAEQRRQQLEDAIKLYSYFTECDDFDKWMREKEKMLRSEDGEESVDTAKRKYEKFVTDLSAASKRLEHIVEACAALGPPAQAARAHARAQQLQAAWDRLQRLRQQKEKSLEGASSVELFSRTCDEALEWMISKEQQLSSMSAPHADLSLTSVRALQRRHAQLERELEPVKEKVNTISLLADSVKSQYPSESENISSRQREIHAQWRRCEAQARERRGRLESAVGHQIFSSSAQDTHHWIQKVRSQLAQTSQAKDVATADALHKQHQELLDDIKAHDDDVKEVISLGKQLLSTNPALTDVAEKIHTLETEQAAMKKEWQEKEAFLKELAQLQAFNREADRVDAATRAHEAYLEYAPHGSSVDEAEALVKRHEELEARLSAQDERVTAFTQRATTLLQDKHRQSEHIAARLAAVVKRREGVKQAAAERRRALHTGLAHQQFVASAEELQAWIEDKTKTAKDQSYRDLANLERKLQKHEAFERELQANEKQLRNVESIGSHLSSAEPARADEIQGMAAGLRASWAALGAAARAKGARLRQAAAQRNYKRSVDDAKARLQELERALKNEELGADLRSCKKLLTQHQALELELSQCAQKAASLAALGEDLVSEGHFDSDSIRKEGQRLLEAVEELKEPAARRRKDLETSLQIHKFSVEVSNELDWLSSRRPAAEAAPADLHAAQHALKNHHKLRAELHARGAARTRLLQRGAELRPGDRQKEKIAALCQELESSYASVVAAAEARGAALEAAVKEQQFQHDAAELDAWLADKGAELAAAHLGGDRHRATQLLTRHKAVELELDTYAAIISEMGHAAAALDGGSGALSQRHAGLQDGLQRLQRAAGNRQAALVESVCRHEYMAESAELESWIQEQYAAASSEDYGQDYEHLLILRSKFEELRLRVECGAERFTQCEELAHKLAAGGSPHLADIERRQQALGESWQRLVDQIASRGSRLHAAGDIHRFHRDVCELLARAGARRSALAAPPPPRDLRAADKLLRNHQAAHNELVAIDAQAQVLQEEGTRLISLYPGDNVQQIKQQQQAIRDAWEMLQQQDAETRRVLEQYQELHQFLAEVRDLLSYLSGVRAQVAGGAGGSAGAAAAARARHDALRAELDATDAPLQRVLQHGQALVDKGHPNAQEISEKCAALVSERAAAGGAWAARQVALDQLLDLHCFRRDLAQLADLCAAHEAVLQSDIPPNSSVEEVDNYIKKHEAFEKLLATQDEKLSTLNSHGEKLLQQNHVESQLIAEELDKINARRKKVYALSSARRARLSSLRARAQFARDAADARGWVLHKLGQLDADHSGEVTSLEEKIKKLQKHQAFSAELVANRARLKEVQELAARLGGEGGEGGGGDGGVRDELRALEADWERLEDATEKRGRGLEEAQDILEFNQHLDKIEAWIRDKEMMVLSGELGRDFEHCSALLRKLDDVDSDMQVDDKRVKSICALADKLLQQGPSAQSVSVSSRRDAVLLKWRALSGALQAYRDRLAAALEIHRFNRDVADTAERLSSKASLFKSMSVGRELSAAHELVKRHHARVAEAGAVRDKIDALKAEGEKLQQRFPERAAELQSSVAALEEGWGTLERLARQRTEALDAAVQRHKFDDTLKDMELWVSETVKRMDDAAEPESVADAEALLELHKERKAEIDGRQKAIASLQKEAEGQEPEARRRVAALAATLDTAWAQRKQYLTQAHQLQLLKEQARQTEDWLASKEAFLNNDDLGENLAAVEALIRKHAEFSKLLDSQLGRVEELQAFAREIQDDHYSKDYIEMRMKSITARRDQLKESCATRGSRLQQSRQLQQFLRDLRSEREYIALKMQLANDDNYRDLSNLQSKIQKHAAFESELAANKGRIDDIANTGEALIEAKHYASQEIAVHVEELENDWRELQAAAKLRRERLDEAYQARVFLRGLDEFTAWLDDVEAQLLSEDHGVDLSSVTALLKRHARLEQTVSSKAERCAALADTARQLPPQHFMRQDILARCDLQTNRYRQLQEPMQIRRDNLEDAALLHRWERDADDEFNWLKERDAALNQEDLGSSLQDAQALLKKHLALEAEIIAREPSLKAVVSRGSALVRRSHFASPTLEPRARALAAAWDSARAAAARRTQALKTACDLMQLLSDVAEAEAFLSERRPLLVSADVGRDEESALALQKRLDGLQRDLNAQDARIAKLQERATMDDEQLKRRLEELKTLYEEMKLLSAKRQQRLQQSLKYFKFAQECEEVQEWVGEQMAVAASEEYGLDVEHVETLQQSFDNFLTQLHANEGRIEAVCESGLALLDENTPESERVKQRIDDIRGLWDDLKELALARQEALAGARQVHEFDRLAAETVVWVQERLAALHTTSDRRAGHALDQQYRTLTHDAERLGAAFPDAREHVTCKLHEVRDALEALAAAEARTAAQRALHDQLEDYFDRHQELLAWSNEMLARVTAPDLAPDVAAAERLVARHHDLKVEIDAKEDDFNQLYAHGEKLVTEGHLMSAEITSRMATLRSRRVAVEAAWDKRASLYEQHLDALVFKRDADALDAWITNRVPLVRDGKFGESLVQVERLLNKHRDLEETIDAQRGNFDALKRITLVEQAFQRQKNEEEQERRLSAERQEQERLQQYRRREMERIAEERRKEGGEGQRETAHAPPMPATPEETTAPPQFDRLPKNENNVKRAESMSFVKSPRRTPSFTTRRRTQSFRRHRHGDIAELPPVEIEGFLERKQETGVGGKRATVRSWRNYYSVLCGQLLCFFKDEQDFANAKAAAPPVAIMQARCAPAADYSKRSHVFRLSCADGAEFLFAAASRALAADWTNKVSFHAALPPELQLTPYSDVAGAAALESPSSSSSASPSQSPAPRRQADILRERDENRNIESSVLPSPPPRLPTPQQEEADVQLRGEAGGWGRSRFSNGRDINAEFIRSQQTADTTDKPPPVPARPSPRPSPRDSPGHSPRPAAPRMPPIPDNSVSSLVNSYQQRTNRTASWSERQNNNWQSESHFYTNDVAYGASGPRPASVATSGGSPALDQRPASRSSGESELSVSGVSKEKKDKKGVFGGLFRKKRPQSHNN